MFESDCPEFIISERLFTWRLKCIESAGFRNRVGLPVVAYYYPMDENEDQEMNAYPGKLKSLLPNLDQEPDEHLMNSGYGTMEVEWDTGGSDSVLSPWELTLPDKVYDTPFPPCLDEAEIRAIGNALAKIETNPNVKDFFLHPVDEKRYPDYRNRVEVPMDFAFIKERLAAGFYCGAESALADAKLIRDNCIKYNGPNDLSQNASAIYDEFEQEVRGSIGSGQNLRSTSLEALNGAASQVDASRATRHVQRQQQGPSTRRSSAEATSLEQLPLPNARHSEGRPPRRSRLGRNGEPSLVTIAPRRTTRSGIASSEVVEEASSEGNRSITEHDQEALDAVEEPSEASSSEGRSESESDDDVAPIRRPNSRGQRPSRQNAARRSGRTNRATPKRKNAEPLASDYGGDSGEESLPSEDLEDEHSSEEEDQSPAPSSPSRRPTRASASTSHRENPRTSSRCTRARANSTEDEHSSEKGAESPPASQQRSTRASATMPRREGPRTSPRLSRARANSTEDSWSSPRRSSRAQPAKSMADLSNSEIDYDEDSSEEGESRNVSQRQQGGRGKSKQSSGESLCVLICCRCVTVGCLPHYSLLVDKASESRSSGGKQGSVLSRGLGGTPRSTKSNGSKGSKRPADSTGGDLSSRRSFRKRTTRSMADVSNSEASDDDTVEEVRTKEGKKEGSSKRPAGESHCCCFFSLFPSCGCLVLTSRLPSFPGKPSGKRPSKRAKSQRSEPDEGFPQLNAWPEIDLKQITPVTHAVLEQMVRALCAPR
jgi:hypothetical protein